MARSGQLRVVEQTWCRLQQTAAQYGATWLVLGVKRRALLAAALADLGALGAEGLILAIEGYAHKTREWPRQLDFLTPESIFRPSHLAQNVEAGALARKEKNADAERREADARISESPLWD